MAVHQIIGVVAVRHRLMTAAGSVLVVFGVAAAIVLGRAGRRVGRRYRQLVFLDGVAVYMVQVAVVQVIDVPVMPHGRMAAVGSVLMTVVGVRGSQGQSSFFSGAVSNSPACASAL